MPASFFVGVSGVRTIGRKRTINAAAYSIGLTSILNSLSLLRKLRSRQKNRTGIRKPLGGIIMRTAKLTILIIMLGLVACKQDKPDFKVYVNSFSQIKTPMTFVDANTLVPLVGKHDLALDTLFFGVGFIPVGKIQSTATTVSLLVLETEQGNKIHIMTFDLSGKKLETFELNSNWGRINDSTETFRSYTFKNQNVLLREDSTSEISHDQDGNEIMTTIWTADTMIVYPNSKLEK